ncbi:nitroreductase family deazaflavin-dependent oxidoreductase [Mycobacterium bourgelatii]|uniref:Nitroreductase n=1 Tax=Mycobacterium bourgelatii TaxID=1273442 RepID=A0A7I9YS43_MYCBU|nr:nitroreductase family deazaflavin-dependent oxidoreductase [Mycobacterium bourgelatii]MCV6974181.1 nitroreductase family deazaflavin-dependent oxidoreductase [Mycobacterium bourgelatii]GFG91362.1 hypothetical protein MBOU_34040 [Mycobacterium bourgelatii]
MALKRSILLFGLAVALTSLSLALLLRLFSANRYRLIGSGQFRTFIKRFNSTTSKVAGTPLSPHGLLTHTGRRSGRVYQTPLGTVRHGDGFLVPLTYGTRADWYRNLAAAGGGTFDWKGRTYHVERPEIISGKEPLGAWPLRERIILQLAGIEDFMWLHESHAP